MALAKANQNGGGKKPAKSPAPSTGASTPVTQVTTSIAADQLSYGSGRPDKSLYDSEQNKLKAEIEALQSKLNDVKDKIALANKGGPGQERRNQLLAEIKDIRNEQGNIKQTRSKIFEQLKALQDGIQKKVKDLNAARGKVSFRSVSEVDERIKQLDKQVDSGSMKVADEKRALAEINQCKRNRRTVEGFQNEQESIEADRAQADELRKQLDDPEGKAISERYDAIQAELDQLKSEGDKAHAARGKLMDERTEIQGQLDELFNQKRDSTMRFREANDRYWAKVNEDRARRAERMRAQRAADDEAKKKEVADRLREEAEMPAFQAQIEDCQTLIDYFSGKSSAPPKLSTDAEKEKANLAGVPQLEIRKVEAASDGMVVRKKKGEEEESYFVGGGGKQKKGKKHGAKVTPTSDSTGTEAPSTDRVNIPLATLSALLSLSIPPPTSTTDSPRVVEDLQTKKAWFQANQSRVTAENKAKVEQEIQRLTGKHAKVDVVPQTDELTPPNGGAEHPAEPAPTPSVKSLDVSTAVPGDEVEGALESVKETEDAAEQ
ncbi:hypothetical protein EW026_g5910 [Hermanssonia centrifuga]|uniref:Nuclear segregation protein Bfr1 n=1 Tax=Hermanssonia centrifuga TaxID=98765 RepID=A0A4S4KCL6_9APHY|nr:hypothetical protein EW026_g5910 [Hermanssonia centrifuga]